MATLNDTKDIIVSDTTKPTVGEKHATSTDDISTTYTIKSYCKISDFYFYQPSGCSTTINLNIGGDTNQQVSLVSGATATSGAGQGLPGRELQPGDTVVITQTNTSGYKGYRMGFQAHRA